MSEHTPGPWSIANGKPRDVTLKRPHFQIGVDRGKGIALVFGDDDADARLIAAAPDLLEALKAYVAACHHQGLRLGPITGLAEAAIEKAERGAR